MQALAEQLRMLLAAANHFILEGKYGIQQAQERLIPAAGRAHVPKRSLDEG